MTYASNKITIEHNGQEYSAMYTVNSGVVNVIMQNEDGGHIGTSTYIDGSPVESVARSLLGELLKDIGVS